MSRSSNEERHVFPDVPADSGVGIETGGSHCSLVRGVVVDEAPFGVVNDVNVAHRIERLSEREADTTLESRWENAHLGGEGRLYVGHCHKVALRAKSQKPQR
jgi:hypothetical protein